VQKIVKGVGSGTMVASNWMIKTGPDFKKEKYSTYFELTECNFSTAQPFIIGLQDVQCTLESARR